MHDRTEHDSRCRAGRSCCFSSDGLALGNNGSLGGYVPTVEQIEAHIRCWVAEYSGTDLVSAERLRINRWTEEIDGDEQSGVDLLLELGGWLEGE